MWVVPFLSVGLTLTAVQTPETEILRHHSGWVGGVAFSDDSRYLATAGDRTVHVLDLTRKKPPRVLRGHRDLVCAVAFARGSNIVASASFDHTARLFNLASEAEVTLKGHRGPVLCVAFEPEAKWVATGSIDATAVIWDVATGKPLHTLTAHQSWVNAVAFNCVGDLATGSSDNTVRLWRLGDKGWIETNRFEFPEGEVRALAFAPSGKTLVAGVRYGFIKIIDLENNKVITRKPHDADVWAVAFSADGKMLATGDGDWDRPGSIRLWDTAVWEPKQRLETTGEVLSLAISPGGRHLVAGCWDQTVHLIRVDGP